MKKSLKIASSMRKDVQAMLRAEEGVEPNRKRKRISQFIAFSFLRLHGNRTKVSARLIPETTRLSHLHRVNTS